MVGVDVVIMDGDDVDLWAAEEVWLERPVGIGAAAGGDLDLAVTERLADHLGAAAPPFGVDDIHMAHG